MSVENEDDSAPGWDAITAACEKLYPNQEPKHYGTVLPSFLGGNDPLTGISAWKRLDPIPHWHFVTYGFSELFEKENDDPDISGFGFELTFRLATDPNSDEPPAWPMNLLQNLARYIFESGNFFASGHWMNANGPIALETNTLLCSLAFITDPELPPISTPNGRVEFLQIVGLTADEEMAAKKWAVRPLLETFAPLMPLWITDLDRPSLLEQPDVRARIEQGAQLDGSNSGLLFTEVLGFKTKKKLFGAATTCVTVGAQQVEELTVLLPLRLPFGRDFALLGSDTRILFAAGPENGISEKDETPTIFLTNETMREIATLLKPLSGEYDIPSFPGLRFEVKPTEIKDSQGNITKIIG